MKKIVWALCAVLALGAIPLMVRAADASKTLTGEPIDIACYLGGKSGEGHAACAATCCKGGKPAGLLVDEGGKKQIYLILEGKGKKAAETLEGHWGKQTKVTGKVAEKDGLKTIEIESAA